MELAQVDKTRITQETIKEMLNNAASLVQVGKTYSHYKKSDKYIVLGISLSADTLEKMFIYQALYGVHGVWVRPLSQWIEKVEVDGKLVDRFALEKESCNSQSCHNKNCD